jgi:D-glycero-D-manno-heptose 1,7-bisphosphate phosphatase
MLVLLGRDGVITDDVADAGADPRAANLLPCAGAAVRRLNDSGHRVVVVLERRRPALADAPPALWRAVEDRLRDALRPFGARLDRVLPPDSADGNPHDVVGAALRAHRAAASEAIVVSDFLPLLEAAAAAGCRRVLVRTGAGARLQAGGLPAHILPVAVHRDLGAAVDALVGQPL